MKRPAFQFYPADWRKDVELQSCSMAAQGLWINAMCLAHECEPYGHLTINSKAMTAAQLGRQVGLSSKEAEALLTELLDSGVASKTDDGVIYSRRMVEDERLRNIRADSGRLGGNPALVGKKDKQEVNQTPKQKPTPSSSSSSSSSKKKGAKAPLSASLPTWMQGLIDLWHEVLPDLPGVEVINAERQQAAKDFRDWVMTTKRKDGTPRATNDDEMLAWARDYFGRARHNDFIMGRGPRSPGHENWRCSFEYLLSAKGMQKVIEQTIESTS